MLYQQVKHSLILPEDVDFLTLLQELQENYGPGIAAVRARSQGEEHDEELAEQMLDAGQIFLRMDNLANLLPLPPLGEDTSDHLWQKTGRGLLESFQSGMVNPYAMAYAGLGRAWRDQSPETFNTIVELYTAQLDNKFSAQMKKADAERIFNAAAPFYTSLLIYVFAFLIAFASWLIWPEPLQKSAYWLLILAWVATTAGILTRMWLEGRPPVTNLYSSALFVGWGCVGLCIILEKLFPNGIGATAGGLTGFATMVIAHQLSLTGDTLEMMRAVLDSNFWLATHVIIITIGYSATFLSGFLAVIYFFRGIFTKSLDKETAKSLERMVYGIVCFATLFSLVGTILGGIWADQSWGRFWGWDPKENGALLIVIWNAIILHARWGGLARTRGIMALAIFGNIVTSWSWFGTNMLGVGLHSYGFMDEAFTALVAFVAVNLLAIAIAYVPAGWLQLRRLFLRHPSTSIPLLRGNDVRLGRLFEHILHELSLMFSAGPFDAAHQHVLKILRVPYVFAVPHGIEPHPAVAIGTCPRQRVVRAIVFLAFHTGGFHHQQHMVIGRKFLQGIPLLLHGNFRGQSFITRKIRVDHARGRHLLRTMVNKLPSQHLNVGIRGFAI